MDLVLRLIGIVFTGIGAMFAVLFTVIGITTQVYGLLFGGLIGLLFFGLGVGFLVHLHRHFKRRAALLENGQRIWADIVAIDLDTRYRYNGRCPFVVRCQAKNPQDGRVYLFNSESFWYDPGPYLEKIQRLPVYVDPDNYRHYAVDVEQYMPQFER